MDADTSNASFRDRSSTLRSSATAHAARTALRSSSARTRSSNPESVAEASQAGPDVFGGADASSSSRVAFPNDAAVRVGEDGLGCPGGCIASTSPSSLATTPSSSVASSSSSAAGTTIGRPNTVTSAGGAPRSGNGTPSTSAATTSASGGASRRARTKHVRWTARRMARSTLSGCPRAGYQAQALPRARRAKRRMRRARGVRDGLEERKAHHVHERAVWFREDQRVHPRRERLFRRVADVHVHALGHAHQRQLREHRSHIFVVTGGGCRRIARQHLGEVPLLSTHEPARVPAHSHGRRREAAHREAIHRARHPAPPRRRRRAH